MEASDIYIPPETYVLGQAIHHCVTARRMPWADLVAYVVGRFDYEPEFYHFNISSLRSFAIEMAGAPPEAQNLESLLDALYFHFAREVGVSCTTWGDKTPYNTYYLSEIAATFPNGRFIALQRNGCDVVASYVHAGLYPNYEAAARRWVESVKLVERFKQRAPEKVQISSYEAVIKDADVEVERIMNFAGLAPRSKDKASFVAPVLQDAKTLAHLQKSLTPVDPSNTGRGLDLLRADTDNGALRRILNPELRRLGYEEI